MKKNQLFVWMAVWVMVAACPFIASANQGYVYYYDPSVGSYVMNFVPGPTGVKIDPNLEAQVRIMNQEIANLSSKISQMMADSKTRERIENLARDRDRSEMPSTQLGNLLEENQALKKKLEMMEGSNRQLTETLAKLGSSSQNMSSLFSSSLSEALRDIRSLSEKFSSLAQGICPIPKA